MSEDPGPTGSRGALDDELTTLRERMIALGAERFLELGPGNVLTGLIRRIDRNLQVNTLGTVEQIEGF